MTQPKPISLAQLQRFAARMPGASWNDANHGLALISNGQVEIYPSGFIRAASDARALYAALKILFEECGSENGP